ncbi:MAG: hypothetical protein OEM02_03325 [Desulfobulbaceae bacterium]|nr:hypothetical protein [Desulfobulbaceae bacterium]
MKHSLTFKLIAILAIWLHASSLAMAGMVITDSARSWAKDVVKLTEQEKELTVPGEPNTLAVLYYRNRTGNSELNPLQKGLTVMLITDLAKVEKIRIVERIRLQALLDEMELGVSGLADPTTISKLGGLLGASFATSGDIFQAAAKNIRVTPGIMEMVSQNISQQADAMGALEELFRVEKEILFNIISEMNILLTPAEKKELEKPLSLNFTALLALFKGIELSDQSKYEQAAKMYHEALFNDPHLNIAREAIEELEQKKLIAVLVTTSTRQESSHIVSTGIGLALLGGGAYYALSSSDEDKDDNTYTPPVDSGDTPSDDGDTTPPTVTIVGGKNSVSCFPDSIEYSFSEAMNTSYGVVETVPTGWTLDSSGWNDSRTYRVAWDSSNEGYCNELKELRTILTGFRDLAGNDLPTTSVIHTFTVSDYY